MNRDERPTDLLRRRLKRRLATLGEWLEPERATETTAVERVAAVRSDLTTGEEPPVVARMMIEIRSDGSRTIARGALEDAASGERVAIEAEGATPLGLAGSLAKSLLSVPLLARRTLGVVDRGRGEDGRETKPKRKRT